jgi:hypothetical protein
MSSAARKNNPESFPPPPSDEDLRAARERARRPDGVVSPELLALELSFEFPELPPGHPLQRLLNHG